MAAWYSLADLFLSRLDAEAAHGLALRALKSGLLPARPAARSAVARRQGLGPHLPQPGRPGRRLRQERRGARRHAGLGFGFVEIGTVTPRPQEGNPRPRLFRLAEDRAVINRMGFNKPGADAARSRLASAPAPRHRRHQYRRQQGQRRPHRRLRRLRVAAGALADYVTVNVSSPNTPGLRGLQDRDELADLLKRVQDAMPQAGAAAAQDRARPGRRPRRYRRRLPRARIDGLIVSNTTIARPPTCARRSAARPAACRARRCWRRRPRCCAACARVEGSSR